jgi:diadenylate cyclase
MINISAIIQIAILYLVIHSILKAAKGSRFGQVLMGVGILAGAMAAFTFIFHFDVLSRIVHALLAYLAISTVVIFQPEIRRILSTVGAFGFLERSNHSGDGAATPEFIGETILALAERKMGALIAFERGISLRGYEDTGVTINGIFTKELVECIFTPPLPLHDGGMTIRDGRISSAHCVFPVSNTPGITARGMRHRAAIGLSEETDALVVVVSEETGSVSIAHNGKLFRYDGENRKASLLRWIAKTLPRRKRNALFTRLQSYIMKGNSK